MIQPSEGVKTPLGVQNSGINKDDFTKIPDGIPSLEDRINVLYTHGVCEGRLDLNTFVEVGSTQAAKLFGLYPRRRGRSREPSLS